MATSRFADHLLTGIHSARPAANAVPAGTLYSCTTHGLIYQSDGSSAWSTYATLGGTGNVAADAIWDTKGDLAVASAADTAAKLAVGSNNQVLTADSAQTLGVKWATPAAAGGTQLDYVERTTELTITDTTGSSPNTFITANAVSFDGSTRVRIEVFIEAVAITVAGTTKLVLYDGSTALGVLAEEAGSTRAAIGTLVRYLTPSAASHTYSVRAWKSAGTAFVEAGSGGDTSTALPAYIRISTA